MRKFIWFWVIILFPITTLPFLPGDSVRPASIIPTLAGVVLLIISNSTSQTWRSLRGIMLLFFIVYSVLIFNFLNITNNQIIINQTQNLEFLRSAFSLCVGSLFYLIFYYFVTSRQSARNTERWILFSITISVFFAFLQWISVNYAVEIRPVVLLISRGIVASSIDWAGRYNGLAFEPSWLASQLTVIALPLLLSRLLSGSSLKVIRVGIIRIPTELLYLFVILLGVILTDSRTALLSSLVIFAFCALTVLNRRNFLSISAFLCLIFAFFWPIASNNSWVGRTIANIGQTQSIVQFSSNVGAGPRLSAWLAGWTTFQDHPFLGVGLGNSYLYYPTNVPKWALQEPEVQSWINPTSGIKPNTKNMPIRLLAETGLVGFAIYFCFVCLHFQFKPRTKFLRVLYVSTAIALLFNYFSLDTFSLPTEWFALGFVFIYGKTQEGMS